MQISNIKSIFAQSNISEGAFHPKLHKHTYFLYPLHAFSAQIMANLQEGSLQWYWQLMNVTQVWKDFGDGSNKIVVAVFDNDFDITHPDFQGKIYKGKDFYVGNVYDDNGELVSKPFQIMNHSAHGTACASIAIAARNGKGVIGGCPNALFMPVRVAGSSEGAILDAIKYAIDNGAHVISASIGTSPDDSLSDDAKNQLAVLSKRIIICFATGNDGVETVSWANQPGVIGIGASTILEHLADYSNFGSNVSLCASSDGDGQRVVAADIVGEAGDAPGDISYDFGGTSAACPMAAGIIAQMLSVNPKLRVGDVKAILKATGVPIPNKKQGDTEDSREIPYKHVRIDAYAAVKEAKRRAMIVV